jgi:hypothetical protein
MKPVRGTRKSWSAVINLQEGTDLEIPVDLEKSRK